MEQFMEKKRGMATVREKTGDMATAGVLFVIGLAAILLSRLMPLGEFSVPGPGFFPTLLGSLLCIVSGILAVRLIVIKGENSVVRIGHPHIWATLAALLGVAVFFEPLGFIPVIALFIFFCLMTFSALRWIACLLIAVSAAAGVFLFFNVLLGVQLPAMRWFGLWME
jgi:putative tricarboxylic transport membrane protein